ncbi:rhamnose utilisation protein RhaD (predicted bifunctional aldolase and dehydrogenase) [Hoeflea halophila]|uniref:Rhamnose utilisation protein RhaD (Predicted bifunctional aldolase and dehydrogenase) n=1 Tax=Hoeflea halophila TaxID=714899 RepID=A0A286IFQ6_9HYPH|nr:bifunctional aldolase/short-chain dehydrogenase [Hoeflea halophila]SOE18958.1 rhamnose utilisation protein RhaD (predicted bifunctional aldolase and dehydrogenase) [Hoeflea halophila]
MIVNRYDKKDAQGWIERAGDDEADRDLMLRIYTSRLIGQDPDLVMHGGGNTSVKVQRANLFGHVEDILHVKGSGRNLSEMNEAGLPGLKLEPLRDLRELETLRDEEMVNVLRRCLLDTASPNPSVETLLHAFLPHKFVDHTHATPFLVLASLPNAEEVCREIFGDRIAVVPYVFSGFGLGKAARDILDANPDAEGLLLLKHGHVTFGETARESYDRVVGHANEAARYFGMAGATISANNPPAEEIEMLAVLRGAIAGMSDDIDAPMPVFDIRTNTAAHAVWQQKDVDQLAGLGVATPDHVIHLKPWPLVLPKSLWSQGRDAIHDAVQKFKSRYQAYFTSNALTADGAKTMLSPEPRHAWVEGVGIVGIGRNRKIAKAAGDLSEQNMRVRLSAVASGGYQPVTEREQFGCEYWSLEQAKIVSGKPPAFEGKVVLVTGGAGTIGLATAKAFAAQGANCVLIDLSEERLQAAVARLGAGHSIFACDVTDAAAADAAVTHAVQRFGGVDILVSNAGSAVTGSMLDMDDAAFRQAFELNFFAHKNFAVAAARMMKVQGRPGQILFNISKQAVNPGPKLGAYGIPKAATMFMMRQLALELGGDGIRVNGVNADRIRSGLLTNEFIKERAASRGLSETDYMGGNLLNREVEASHVANAFVALALSDRTTGHVMTVDGGNTAAELR